MKQKNKSLTALFISLIYTLQIVVKFGNSTTCEILLKISVNESRCDAAY